MHIHLAREADDSDNTTKTLCLGRDNPVRQQTAQINFKEIKQIDLELNVKRKTYNNVSKNNTIN